MQEKNIDKHTITKYHMFAPNGQLVDHRCNLVKGLIKIIEHTSAKPRGVTPIVNRLTSNVIET